MRFDDQERGFRSTEEEQKLVPCPEFIPEAEAPFLLSFIQQKIGWMADATISHPQFSARSAESQDMLKKMGILQGMVTVMNPIVCPQDEPVLQQLKDISQNWEL